MGNYLLIFNTALFNGTLMISAIKLWDLVCNLAEKFGDSIVFL